MVSDHLCNSLQSNNYQFSPDSQNGKYGIIDEIGKQISADCEVTIQNHPPILISWHVNA